MNFFSTSYFVPLTIVSGYVAIESDAPKRIYAQYRGKPKAVAWYNIARQLASQIADAAAAVRIMYDIDFAQGEQLDVIGRIVVIPRDFVGKITMETSMFATPENEPGEFGDTSAMFSAPSVDQSSKMSDDLYRIAIKSKILKNNSFATIDDIMTGMNFMLPNAQVVRIVDGEDMSFSVEFYGQISNLERWALLNAALVPKPQGVKFNGFLEAYDYVQAGDSSKQFGDTYSEFTGFIGA